MNPEWSELKRQEEQKRDGALGAAERWRLILAAIAWAEAQPQVQRNTPARCLALERAKLAGLAASSSGGTDPPTGAQPPPLTAQPE